MENLETATFKYKKDFSVFLKRELLRRSKKNSSYSLRSFARSLEIDPSLLSKLLNGKRSIGHKHIDKLGQKLGLSLREIESFKGLQESKEEKDFYQLSLDEFDIISDWQHYAILEMMNLDYFVPDLKWIAQGLNMELAEVEESVERLKRVGLLKINDDGEWIDSSGGHSTHILDKNFTSYAHKKSQKNILTKAIESLESTPIEKRDQSSMMVTTSPEKMSKAKEMIKDFRRQLTAFLEDTDDKSAVYQLSVSLFPLLEIKNRFKNTKEQ